MIGNLSFNVPRGTKGSKELLLKVPFSNGLAVNNVPRGTMKGADVKI